MSEVEECCPADLICDLDLLHVVWDLRWSSSSQPWLRQAPWLENRQILEPVRKRVGNILDSISGAPILDGLDDWPRSATRKEWFCITRELVASTIAEMGLDPAALAEVEEAFIGAGLL